jgi:hypothetical protein
VSASADNAHKKQGRERPLWIEEICEYLSKKPNEEAPLRLVSEHGMRFVPPGPAWREGMAKRKTDAVYRGASSEEVRSLENIRVIRTGSKRIVLKAIYYECKAGRLAKFEREGRTWVRLDRDLC